MSSPLKLFELFDRDLHDDQLAERGGRIVGHHFADTALSAEDFFPHHVRRCTFERVSFRDYESERLWVRESLFRSCDFTGAKIRGFTDWQNTFENCIFDGAVLDGAGIGFYGSKYRQCRYTGAGFRRAVFGRPEFDESEFIKCRMTGLDFNAGSFERCRFTGRLREVWFRNGFEFPRDARKQGKPQPNRMLEVDFSEVVLEDCMFTGGVPLDTVILPRDGKHLLYDGMQRRARAVLDLSRDWPEPHRSEGESYFEMMRHYPEQQWEIINLDNMTEMFGDSARLIVEALGEPVGR